MSEFLQQLVNGVTWGSVYALIALGYTMVYGILRLINFAHGDVYMLGAFFGLLRRALRSARRSDPQPAQGAAACCWPRWSAAAWSGFVIERFAYKPVRKSLAARRR